MTKNYLYWINVSLSGVIILLISFVVGSYLTRSTEIPLAELVPKTLKLPRGNFAGKNEDYIAIGPPLLHLNFVPPSLQLPDLRNHLTYFGRNDRPDADRQSLAVDEGGQ